MHYLCQFKFVLGKRLCQLSWDLLFCSDDLAILSEGLGTFEMRGNHSEDFMCVNEYLSIPSWMEFPLQKLYKSKKVAWIVPITKSFKFTFRRNQTPWMSRVLHPSFSCRIQEISKISDLKRYRGTSRPIKRRVCGCPWSIPVGKTGGKGKGPLGMEGPDERINPINHEYA